MPREGIALNPQNPNRNNSREHRQAGNRPASLVNRVIRFRPVHQRIVPVGHNSLLEVGRQLHSRPVPKNSFSRQRRARGTNQFVRFDEDVVIVRLLFGKKADGHKRRTKQQAYQHDFSVGALVCVVK
jgi:hypothetical protein